MNCENKKEPLKNGERDCDGAREISKAQCGEISSSDDEMIDAAAARILKLYRAAFLELAK